jgi:predicted Zn-dependent protease
MVRSEIRAKLWRRGIIVLSVLALAACGSSSERYARHIAGGQEFSKAGNYVKASLEFRTALQINPAGVEANYQLGLISETMGDWATARDFFTKVTNQNPRHVLGLLHQGRIDLMVDDKDSALQHANTLLSVDPSNSEGHALRGAVLLRQGQLEGAESEAAKSLQIQPENAPGVALLAGIRVKQGQGAQAIGILNDGIKANPDDNGLKLTKIKILDDAGDGAGAQATLKDVVDRNPKIYAFRLELARRMIADKKLDEAEKLLRDGAVAEPSDPSMELALVEFLRQSRSPAAAERELVARVSREPKQYAYKFVLADLYFGEDKKAEARRLLQDIVVTAAKTTNALTAKVALARYAMIDGKAADAESLLDEVLKNDAANGEALLLRAHLKATRGEYPSAIADLRLILRDAPNSKPAMVMLARAYIANGEPELGGEFLQRASDEDPADVDLRVEYARHLMASRQVDMADRQLTLALGTSPGFAPAMLARASVLAAQHRWTEAEAAARQLIAMPNTQAQGHALLGKIRLGEKKYADAIAELKTALAGSPDARDVAATLAHAYLDSGDGAGAVKYVQSLIAQRPENAGGYQLLGDIQSRLNAKSEAVQAYQQSIELDPTRAGPRLSLGTLLAKGGDFQSAEEVFRAGVRAVPGSVELRLSLALAEDHLNRFQAAKSDYEEVLRQRPRNVVAANNLAMLIADAWPTDKKLLEQARRLAEASRNASNPSLIDSLGWVEYRLGNFDDAVALLQNAVAGNSNEPAFHYHLGLAFLAKGDRAKADEQLALAVAAKEPYRGLDEARKALVNK